MLCRWNDIVIVSVFGTLSSVTIYILISVLQYICTLNLLGSNWEYMVLAAVFDVAAGNMEEMGVLYEVWRRLHVRQSVYSGGWELPRVKMIC